MNSTEIKQKENKVENRAAIYEQGNTFKRLLIASLPVLVLMLTNTLYQLIDASIAANMVSYGNGLWKGSIVSMISLPVMLIMMASITLTNIGFGTIFAQRLGQKDEVGAKTAISTMHITNIFIILIGILLSFLMVGPWLKLMDIDLNTIGKLGVDGSNMTLAQDAKLTMIIYAIAIGSSSFQGIISRQLRSEGHIKAASYLPLISIPINIGFDILFMGPLNMGVTGAALATLIAVSVNTVTTLVYTLYLGKKGETYFGWSVFKYGVDWKLFGIMCLIGLAPFFMQMGRAYSQILSMLINKEIGSVASLQLISSTLRPMMLIMMPSMAIIQTSSAMIGYNFGARNNVKVKETIWSALALVFLLSLPQYILIMSWPGLMYWLFGANSLVGASLDYGLGDVTIWASIQTMDGNEVMTTLLSLSTKESNQAYWTYLGMSIVSILPSIVVVYYISTRKIAWAFFHTFMTFFVLFTIIILSFYFTIGQHETEQLGNIIYLVPDGDTFILVNGGKDTITYNPDLVNFYIWMPVWYLSIQFITWPVFAFVRYRDNKFLLEEQTKTEEIKR